MLIFQVPLVFDMEDVNALISIDVNHIESRASKLHGCAGPSRVAAIMLKAWHTRYGATLKLSELKWRSGPQYVNWIMRIRALTHDVRLLTVNS